MGERLGVTPTSALRHSTSMQVRVCVPLQSSLQSMVCTWRCYCVEVATMVQACV